MTEERPRYYILIGRTPVAVDVMTWAKQFEQFPKRFIARDVVTDDCDVSTIFLGIDHNHSGKGPPILFETMIFGGPLDEHIWRYETYAQAEDGHAAAVAEVRKAYAQIKAIAEQAGAKGNG